MAITAEINCNGRPPNLKKYNTPPDIHKWWRHQMETFSALLALCAGNPPVTGEVPAQRPVTRNFDVFCDLRLNKRLSKQSWGWWLETPSCALWRHCNEISPKQNTSHTFNENLHSTKTIVASGIMISLPHSLVYIRINVTSASMRS